MFRRKFNRNQRAQGLWNTRIQKKHDIQRCIRFWHAKVAERKLVDGQESVLPHRKSCSQSSSDADVHKARGRERPNLDMGRDGSKICHFPDVLYGRRRSSNFTLHNITTHILFINRKRQSLLTSISRTVGICCTKILDRRQFHISTQDANQLKMYSN